ncbi:hypothetical protein DL89DRAFT_274209 [Linderina pennispora]|uniref:Methionyl/Leucyl tRNA synthetase domain-containing protein n=1 Tax=Linderina pennispora TaxID=61395 RepID=A0A1Y1WFC7_9FUNG|nr:uncharacterized protein DL89DRAFT_274209 [Linderina pennispora]ORX71946.1 hypothetical protein DL89DRAFT_274209 [Linderina pennispora]
MPEIIAHPLEAGSAWLSDKHSLTRPANNFYVTTPIFYVNSVPHIGHFYSMRYHELLGKTHGLKIQQAAEKAHEQPLAFCTKFSDRPSIRRCSISGTSLGEHSGWYAIEERIDPKTGKPGMFAIESEVNYKFRLSAFCDKLIRWIEETPDAIYPEIRRNEVLGWLRDGMDDLRLQWGIPVPGDADHTIYVWVDALWTAANTPRFFPPDLQVIGKDIVRFHAVYWPALLMAAGLPLPKRILAHAHWTMQGQKMSKSKGNVVDPFQAIAQYGLDPIRYFMMRNGGIADDGDYSNEQVVVRYKKDLVGQLANLAARCLSERLGADLNMPAKVKAQFDTGEFGRGLSVIFDALTTANRHVSDSEPWNIVKRTDPESKARLQAVLFYSLEAVRLASIMIQPVMPDKAAQAAGPSCGKDVEFGRGWQSPGPKTQVPGVAQLFPKLE